MDVHQLHFFCIFDQIEDKDLDFLLVETYIKHKAISDEYLMNSLKTRTVRLNHKLNILRIIKLRMLNFNCKSTCNTVFIIIYSSGIWRHSSSNICDQNSL